MERLDRACIVFFDALPDVQVGRHGEIIVRRPRHENVLSLTDRVLEHAVDGDDIGSRKHGELAHTRDKHFAGVHDDLQREIANVSARFAIADAVRRQFCEPLIERCKQTHHPIEEVPATCLPRLIIGCLRRVHEQCIAFQLEDRQRSLDLLHQRFHEAAHDHLAVS
jgi:hypothetical protein